MMLAYFCVATADAAHTRRILESALLSCVFGQLMSPETLKNNETMSANLATGMRREVPPCESISEMKARSSAQQV